MTQREILKQIRASKATWLMLTGGIIRQATTLRCPLQVLRNKPARWIPGPDDVTNAERLLIDAADNVLSRERFRLFRAKVISACGLGPANERGA